MSFDEFENSDAVAAVPQDQVVFTDLDGAEGVLVDLDTRKYYQLNETAALIWRGLEKHYSVEQIAGELATIYDVPPVQAAASVARLIQNLSVHKLVRSS